MSRGIRAPKLETGPNCEGCQYREWSQGFTPMRGYGRYMVVTEAPRTDAVVAGEPMAGGELRIFNSLRTKCTNLKSSEIAINPAVKCRPVQWMPCQHCGGAGCDKTTVQGKIEIECYKGKIPKISQYTHDYIDAQPDMGQVAECSKRYLYKELAEFGGDTILGMGQAPLQAISRQPLSVIKYNGTVFQPGKMEECTHCKNGYIQLLELKTCKDCRNGARKRLTCEACSGQGKVKQPGKKRKCTHCNGKGETSPYAADVSVSTVLAKHQLYLQTFAPLYLMKDRTKFPAAEAAFTRLESLHDEGDITEEADYLMFPAPSINIDWPKAVAIDIENDRGDPKDPSKKIKVVSVSPRAEESIVMQPTDSRFLDALKSDRIIGQNYMLHDAWWIYHKYGVLPKEIWDTRFGGHLLDPDTPNNLTTLSVQYAQPKMPGFWKSESNYKNKLATVCGLDTDATYRIYNGERLELLKTNQLPLMEEHVVPLCSTLLRMRIGGMKIDTDKMEGERKAYVQEVEEGRKMLPWENKKEYGDALRKWIYDDHKWPKFNEQDGERNTKAGTLERLRDEYLLPSGLKYEAEVINNVLSIREMSKLASTFLNYPASRVHPQLNPGGTGTFRLSCKEPNAQNIPGRTRHIFIPDAPDRLLTSMDMSQAEVVTFLWLAEQWDIYDKVIQGFDVHDLVTDLIFGSGAHKDKEKRTMAKVTTFAILFGETPETTSRRLGKPQSEIDEMRVAYFRQMKGVDRYVKEVLNFCKQRGYVINPAGYMRYIRLSNYDHKGHGVNQAINTPIQSTPAFFTRQAMIEFDKIKPAGSRLWMQVHDELIVEHAIDQTEAVKQCLKAALWAALDSSLLIGNPYSTSKERPRRLQYNVQFATANNWGEAK